MFDDLKVAVIVDIFWKLLEFNPDETESGMGSKIQGGEFEPIDEKPELQGNPSGSTQGVEKSPQNFKMQSSPRGPNADNNNIEYRGDDIDIEAGFETTLRHKFAIFRSMIMQRLHEKNPALKFNKEECKRIAAYGQESYFKHLRLYEFVFNNKTATELKKVNFKQDVARTAAPLTQALQISSGRAPDGRGSTLESQEGDENHRVSEFGDTQN